MKPMQLECAMIRKLVITVYDRLTSPKTRQELAEQLAPLFHLRPDQIEQSPEVFAEIACFKLVLECLVLQSTLPEEQLCDPEWGLQLSHRCYEAFAEYYTRRSRQCGRMLERGTPQRLFDHICTYEKAVKAHGLAMAGTIFSQRVQSHFGRRPQTYSGGTSTILTLVVSSNLLTNYWPEQFEEYEIAPDLDARRLIPAVESGGVDSRPGGASAAGRTAHAVQDSAEEPAPHSGSSVWNLLQIGVERFLDIVSHLTDSRSEPDDADDDSNSSPWSEPYDPLEDYHSDDIGEEFRSNLLCGSTAAAASN